MKTKPTSVDFRKEKQLLENKHSELRCVLDYRQSTVYSGLPSAHHVTHLAH